MSEDCGGAEDGGEGERRLDEPGGWLREGFDLVRFAGGEGLELGCLVEADPETGCNQAAELGWVGNTGEPVRYYSLILARCHRFLGDFCSLAL